MSTGTEHAVEQYVANADALRTADVSLTPHSIAGAEAVVEPPLGVVDPARRGRSEFDRYPSARKANAAPEINLEDLALISTVHSIPARRMICHAKEWSDYVTVVCEGWAASSTALPDGRRQIHSILLSGDIVMSTGPFNPIFGHTVEAVTDVVCRRYKRNDLEEAILKDFGLFKGLAAVWGEARSYGNQLALSLGRRTAHERIACFILHLADRLARRGMVSGDTMDFPLRLKHIADATGLTPVHVSKVQNEFQRADLIRIKDRSLTILDWAELRHMSGPQ